MTSRYLLDIETDDLNATKIYCIILRKINGLPSNKKLSFEEHEIYTYAGGLGYPSLNEFRKKFIKDHDVIFIGHNLISFDIPVINKLLNMDIKLNQIEDTLLLSQLDDPRKNGGHSLKNWGQILNFPKIEFTDFKSGLTQEMLTYCMQDVDLNGKVWMALVNKDIPDNVIETEKKVRYIIHKQEEHGFCLDMPKVMEFSSFLSDNINKIEQELQEIFEPTTIHLKTKTKIIPFNPGSRQQIADRLIKQFGWKPDKFTETGKPMVDEKILQDINTYESLKLVDYLTLQKRNAQVQSWINAADESNLVHGRVHTLGTVTGRMTHSNPNMAQVPSTRAPYGYQCREVWIPKEKDHILLGCDAKSLELRCLAHYMDDEDFSKEVIEGDIHTFNQNKAGLETRDQAKTFIYALIYGAGPAKIGAIVGGSANDGKRLIDNFMSSLPKLQRLKQRVDLTVQKQYIPGLDGRRVPVEHQHTGLNYLLQGAGAIICKHWLIQMYYIAFKKSLRATPIANIHDEMQWEVHENDVDKLTGAAHEAIKNVREILKFRCDLGCDVKTGKNWAETH
jgi:DNA polymerase I-like protein with 3'-5' exonuclease and polymerase domains